MRSFVLGLHDVGIGNCMAWTENPPAGKMCVRECTCCSLDLCYGGSSSHPAHTHHADRSVLLLLLLQAMGILCVSRCVLANKKGVATEPRIDPKPGSLPQCVAQPCLLAMLMRLLLWPC